MMQGTAALIVAAIGFVICLFGALGAMTVARPGWAFLLAGACFAFAWVFALEWNEQKSARRLRREPFTTDRSGSYPEQRKHPIR